jgi:hypothetical protein
MTVMRKMLTLKRALARPSGRALFSVDSEPSLTVGLMTRSFSHVLEHQPTNQAAEWPHEKPIGAKLSAATAVPTNYPGLRGQDSLIACALFDSETPDSSSYSWGHRRIEAGTVKRRDVSGWSPKPSGHSKQDFVIRFFGQEPALGVNQSLKRNVLIPRQRATAARNKAWQHSETQEQLDHRATQVRSPKRAVHNVG